MVFGSGIIDPLTGNSVPVTSHQSPVTSEDGERGTGNREES
ncbi:hypothetical protein CKA32_002298 [Geitlerinema sp. FC II]|nr:hypothetical protein CKA32_002298 [Geitlerinema sp. FC II]